MTRAAGVRTPIIASSASVLPDEIARTMAAGFDRFLGKSTAPAELCAAVRDLAPRMRENKEGARLMP